MARIQIELLANSDNCLSRNCWVYAAYAAASINSGAYREQRHHSLSNRFTEYSLC